MIQLLAWSAECKKKKKRPFFYKEQMFYLVNAKVVRLLSWRMTEIREYLLLRSLNAKDLVACFNDSKVADFLPGLASLIRF